MVTPGHGGAAGTRVLNAALKEKCNPGPGRFAGFDPGDRVAYSPAPGRTELGQVLGAEQEGLRLRCAGGEVLVARDRVAATLRHGWAVTAHQAVTLRAPAAVVVVPGDSRPGSGPRLGLHRLRPRGTPPLRRPGSRPGPRHRGRGTPRQAPHHPPPPPAQAPAPGSGLSPCPAAPVPAPPGGHRVSR